MRNIRVHCIVRRSLWSIKYFRSRSFGPIVSRDWTCQLKLRNIRELIPSFQSARVAKNIWRIINTTASIWRKNMPECLSLDITFSSKLTVYFGLAVNCSLLVLFDVWGQISLHILAPNGDHCLYVLEFMRCIYCRCFIHIRHSIKWHLIIKCQSHRRIHLWKGCCFCNLVSSLALAPLGAGGGGSKMRDAGNEVVVNI